MERILVVDPSMVNIQDLENKGFIIVKLRQAVWGRSGLPIYEIGATTIAATVVTIEAKPET